ncbi:MAG: GTP cyclohydrolase I [Candidatus Shapirobacteria bacterium]|nr:GTP cyclohydrolase I [Candidatus Shapirobacteria bacterium]MDD5073943.1 GTP cyclohydrolase I [Candidatus Shapirobacteria bacterium]MDD5481893.1 GTP cyclohydrolase I [Candidatus Shapirobacteria bacterium]
MGKTLNLTKAELAAKELLLNLGLDLKDPNYEGTPKRMVEVLAEFTSSLREESESELEKHFRVLFPKHNGRRVEYKGMLVQSPIRVYSLCSHHMLPVIYDIAFAYIPKKGEQIGFSKIVRILRHIAKRPMNQEDFTQEAVDLFYKRLKPQGLAIVVSGVHLCMKMRGVHCEAVNKTSAVKGDFKNYERTRDEFLALATNFNHPL